MSQDNVKLPEPAGWYLLTGHGNSFATERPSCLLHSSWKPAYTADQLRQAVTDALAPVVAERDAYRRDAESLLAISKAAADALEKAEAERDAARAELETVREANDKKAEFIRKMIADSSFNGCDLDGGALQDEAEARGFLRRVEVTEPCRENCTCAEFGLPTYCYRFTDELAALTNKDTP